MEMNLNEYLINTLETPQCQTQNKSEETSILMSMIMKSYRPIYLFEGLSYDQYGRIYISDKVKFVNDLKVKDNPDFEKDVLNESYAYDSIDYPIIEKIISDTREELNKVEVFE